MLKSEGESECAWGNGTETKIAHGKHGAAGLALATHLSLCLEQTRISINTCTQSLCLLLFVSVLSVCVFVWVSLCERRTSNSSATLSSCVSMEPCACPEESMFTALSHADVTFRKMEGYLRSRQLCDVILVAGDRRIPAHR